MIHLALIMSIQYNKEDAKIVEELKRKYGLKWYNLVEGTADDCVTAEIHRQYDIDHTYFVDEEEERRQDRERYRRELHADLLLKVRMDIETRGFTSKSKRRYIRIQEEAYYRKKEDQWMEEEDVQ